MSYDDINRNRRNHSNGDPSEPVDGIHPAVEILSEYLEQPSGLAQAERDAIDRHLDGCEQCQRVLNELQLMVRTLGTLPEMPVPRSFALRPEALEPAPMPERRAPIVLQESARWHERHAGKVRWATAVAAMLFVFVISADLVTNTFRGSDDMATSDDDMEMMSVPESAPASEGAQEAATAAIDSEARTTQGEEPASDEAAPAGEEESAEEEVPQSESDAAQDDDGAATEDEPEVSTYLEPGEDADSPDEADEEAAVLTMEQETVSEDAASEAQSGGDSGQSRWRIAQVSLALVLAVLLAVMIGLPRQRGRRR